MTGCVSDRPGCRGPSSDANAHASACRSCATIPTPRSSIRWRSPPGTPGARSARSSRTGRRVEATFCLAFPDVYDIGMSHLGFKILYKLLNDDPRTLAERCYAPWVDMERELRARGLPLVSLESARPLRDFNVVGFSLQFELTYSNILNDARPRRHPAALGRPRGRPTRSSSPAGRRRRTPSRSRPSSTPSSSATARRRPPTSPSPGPACAAPASRARERLVALARLGAVYVPSLYATRIDADTGLAVVDRPLDAGRPLPHRPLARRSRPVPLPRRRARPAARRRSSTASPSRSPAAAPRAAASARRG